MTLEEQGVAGLFEREGGAFGIRRCQRLRLPRLGGQRVRHLPDSNQADPPSGDPIAFFTALQIASREKGFWRKTNTLNFSALDATKLMSQPEIRIIGASAFRK
jgi:hypothetical protein